ncbi:hypothetical protein [Streptomyces jeddahensis]|uniref:Uncharacterized protein n=1 Tax=Streptomyces jeddahensis TaxID=1716141 RepID=A0A177HJ12_9ACTN|nr:hypothetical protein [Streptomyces jeddahensis]OAH10962.1 hypothetical protein STSP_58040 [Streptomyces jeddahensis]
MRARHASALRAIGRNIGEGLMWMGFAWYGTHPPHPWTGYVMPPAEQPCLPPLTEEELAQWTALVKHL